MNTSKYTLILGSLLIATSLTTACISNRPNPSSTPTSTADVYANVQKTAGQAAAPARPAQSLPSTEEQLRAANIPARDVPDLSVRLRPSVDEVPLVVNSTVPDYQMGEEIQFWVHNPSNAQNTQITARLAYRTDVAYAWVESDQQVNQEALVRSLDRFSTILYPKVRDVFGNEWNPGVDNDPRLHILHTVKAGNGLAGYYSSADEYSKLANPFSNEKEMFYINLTVLNSTQNYEDYEEVLTHELQHMIHWNQDRNEGVWMNEGLSEYAQDVAGFGRDLSFAQSFLSVPDTQLNTWGTVDTSNLHHYGASYLLATYMSQQYGTDFIRTLMTQPGNGIDGIQQALDGYQTIDAQKSARRPSRFDDLFADWVVANYADEPEAAGEYGQYGYIEFDPAQPGSEQIDAISNPTLNGSVPNYATDYIEVSNNLPIIIEFTGISRTQLVPVAPYSGALSAWSNRADESNTRLTRTFDLRSVPADADLTMDVAMWWQIEDGYDYGYVTVSRDGRKWEMLRGQGNVDSNVSGNNFGVGYTANSDGWVIEQFDLSPYRGLEVQLRFELVTDDAVNRPGWLLDDITIPAIGFSEDFEKGLASWQSEGWIASDNQLAKHWLVQVIEFEDDRLVAVKRPMIDENGHATFTMRKMRNGRTTLAISGITPVTTEEGSYQLLFTPAYE